MLNHNRYNPHMLPKIRSEALMRSMKGRPCTLRLCSFIGDNCSDDVTVVGCHAPTIGKGVNTKVSDLFAIAGCSKCHDLLDMCDERWETLLKRYPTALPQRILDALCETLSVHIGEGIIVVPDAEIIRVG